MQSNLKGQFPQKNKQIDYIKAYQDAKSAVRRLDKKVFKSVHKGVQYDWLNNTSFNNIAYPRDQIPPNLLRLCERRNGIVGSIITLRVQQAIEFSNISEDKDVPGWGIFLRDHKKTLSPEQEKQKLFLEDLFKRTRRDDYNGIEKKTDNFKDTLTKYVRDRLLIDKVVWEIERDRKGLANAFWVLDGATIMPVLPGGFYGSINQVGWGGMKYNKLADEIVKAKLDQVPPFEEIAYIQELIFGTGWGGITAAFRDEDIIYDLGNELNDVRYYRQGLSVTEKANIAIVAFMNSVTFNSNGLSRGHIPKVAISMGKDSQYTEEQLEDMQDEWAANFEAMDGQWNIPLLNGDAKILNMLPTNRDMEYQRYMEFVGALTCSIMGVDSAEIGLRLNQAQAVLSENSDAKQVFSKNRGVRETLNGFSQIANKFLRKSGYDFADDFVFRFNGLDTEDKGFEADLRKKNVETIKTIDEVRAEIDLPPLKDGLGDIVLNPIYLQNKQSLEQQSIGQEEGVEEDTGFGGFTDEEYEQLTNEAMQKAVKLI